ncbi:MAG TPA: hypothetical protein VH115_02365 [Solirubrobacteraceae bacterium]|nr:hypothetical protein [Solirubrobacteraceae bacterium]
MADYSANAIDVFAPGANGDVAPVRRIVGESTGLGGPADAAVDSAGDVYASNFNSDTITEYAPGASGNVAPIRTIGGELTGLASNDDISVANNGTIYAGNFGAGLPVVVFAPGASGDVAPVRTLGGEMTGLGQVDGVGADATGTLYVDSGSSIRAFAPGASGNVAPLRVIAGAATELSAPDDVKVGFSGQLFVSDAANSLHVFEAGASGNAAPLRNIAGSLTELTNADDLAVNPEGAMYVTNFATSNVVEFAPTANGDVAPVAKIAGSATTLSEPEGVAIATPAAEATLTTKDSGPAIRGGESTHDTATLEGGTSPTGQLIFKLYGPSDPTCSKAPAFTSGLTEVKGDGSYTGPAFSPTQTGKYSWVVEYGGDSANAPKATGCEEAGELVTVEEGVKPPECTKVFGSGHWGPRGREGGSLHDNLSTTLSDRQELRTTARGHKFHMRLTHLASASCVAIAGGFEFSGAGPAKVNHETGYSASFAVAVTGGHTYYTLIVEKEGAVVYALVAQRLRRDRTEHIS